nr:MAG TPA: hypothetical protein [Caudoviricetes sp.]
MNLVEERLLQPAMIHVLIIVKSWPNIENRGADNGWH